MNNKKYQQAIQSIFNEQEKILGQAISAQLADQIDAITISSKHSILVKDDSDPKLVLENLVNQYSKLFGRASVEVAKDAIKEIAFTPQELPSNLK